MAIKVADAFVMVGGDLSQYRKDLKAGEKDVQSLGQQIRAALTNPAGFGGQSKVAGLIADLKLGRNLTASLRTAATGLGGTLKGLSVNALHSGLNGIKNVLGGLRGLASDVFKGFSIGLGIGSFQALGRVLSDLVNVIPDLIDRGREFSRVVDDVADATGAATADAAKFVGTLQFLGVPVSGVINMLGQMSRNLEEQGPILEKLGVATRDSSGALLDQIKILDNARAAFSRFGVGTAQADQIAREFGRGGLRTLVDYLHLTDEQFERITEDLQKQGLIISDAQRDLAESTVREQARFQNALTGLGETLFTTVGPQIRAFLSNLSDFITEHVDQISTAISNAISFILGLVTSLVGASASLDSFAGSIQAANAVNSPYSAHLLQLRVELGKLELQQEKTTDSTDGQRKAITAKIAVIEREIAVLKRQDAAQDTVFKRQIAGLSRVYQLRLDALDLAERERDNLERQRDLNDQLNQAQLDLQDALRGKAKEGGQNVVDAEEVSKAMARIAEIQRDQADLARDTQVAAQRESLESTRDYIDSIADLLEKAENKRAALNTLRRREDVLEARRQEQLAAGDTGGAADTLAKIEALKTAQVRAQEQIRNEERESALEKQKRMLDEERSAIQRVVRDVTAIRKAELAKQIADLEKQEKAWNATYARMGRVQREEYAKSRDALNGAGGLTEAMLEARDAGVAFGDQVKEALGGLGDIVGGIAGFFGKIKDALDTIAESDVWKFLTDPSAPGAKQLNDLMRLLSGENGPPKTFIRPDNGPTRTLPPSTGKNAPPGTPSYAAGGWIGERGPEVGLFGERGREYVIPHSISEMLASIASRGMPALAGAGAGPAGDIVVPVTVKLDSDVLMRVVERRLADKRRR